MAKIEKEDFIKLELRELQLLQLEAMKYVHNFCRKYQINYYLLSGSLLGAVRHGGFIPWDDDIDIAMMRSDYDKFLDLFSKFGDKDKYFLQHYGSDANFQPALMRVCIRGTIVDVLSEAHIHNCKNTYIDIFPLDNVPDLEEDRVQQQKKLKSIDRLINLELYHIYRNNSPIQIVAKKIIARIVSLFYPLKKLQKARLDEMTRYRSDNTKCVASTVSKYGYTKQIIERSIYGTPKLYRFEDAQFYGVAKEEEYLTHLFGVKYMEVPPVNKRVVPHDVYIKENLYESISKN